MAQISPERGIAWRDCIDRPCLRVCRSLPRTRRQLASSAPPSNDRPNVDRGWGQRGSLTTYSASSPAEVRRCFGSCDFPWSHVKVSFGTQDRIGIPDSRCHRKSRRCGPRCGSVRAVSPNAKAHKTFWTGLTTVSVVIAGFVFWVPQGSRRSSAIGSASSPTRHFSGTGRQMRNGGASIWLVRVSHMTQLSCWRALVWRRSPGRKARKHSTLSAWTDGPWSCA